MEDQMHADDRRLLDEIADRYMPEEGDALDAALDARDLFLSDMSDSVLRRLAGAIRGFAGAKGVPAGPGVSVVSAASDGAVFAGTYSAEETSNRFHVDVRRFTLGDDESPTPFLRFSAAAGPNRILVLDRDAPDDWRAVAEFASLIGPWAPKPTPRRDDLLVDRLLDADGGLPGDLFRGALGIATGRVATAALEGMPEAVEALAERLVPGVPAAIGNGWTAIAGGWPRGMVEFRHSGGAGNLFARTEGPSTGRMTLSGDLLEHAIVHDATAGTTSLSEFTTLPVLLHLADVAGKAVGHAAWLEAQAKEADAAPSP